jgi:hypothetical protein
MVEVDFNAPAGLYSGLSGRTNWRKGLRLSFRRFPTLAEAIKSAIEENPSAISHIEVEDDQIDADEIRRLYLSDEFPLQRRA